MQQPRRRDWMDGDLMMCKKTIMQTLPFGSSFKVGTIVEHDEDEERIHIVWDQVKDNNLNVYLDGFYEWMDYDQFRVGYLHILRTLTTSIRRKNPEDWRAWEFDLKDGAISPEPPNPYSYPEAVLLELDLSDDTVEVHNNCSEKFFT